MKKLFILGIALVAIAFCSFKLAIDKSAATSEAVNGIQVFAFSKPVTKYDILGSVKIKGIVTSEKGDHMVKLFTEKAKKEYPSGEGIIVSSDFEKAEVIKFKD